jgi:hypothetical protein
MIRGVGKAARAAAIVLFTISSGLTCSQQPTAYDVHSSKLLGILLWEGKPLAHEPLELHKKFRPNVPFSQDARYDPWAWGSTQTGENGEFNFGKLPPGIYFIRTSTKVSFAIRLLKPDRQHRPEGFLLELSDEFGCSRVYVKELKGN